MKLLILTSRFPYPINKGDKLRAHHQIKGLSKQFEIHLISISDQKINSQELKELEPYCKTIKILYLPIWKRGLNLLRTFLNNKPFQVNYFYSTRFQKIINSIIKEVAPDHIYCQLIRTAIYMRDQHHIPATLDYMDALSKGIERRISITNSIMKPILKMEFNRLQQFENLAFEFFKHHIIISSSDRDDIMHEKNKQIKVIQNGIDTLYYQTTDIEKKYDLVFVGNLSYAPNIDAATYIANHLVPELIKSKSNLKILIAGSNPSTKVKKLQNDHITIRGWYDDIREAYCSGKVFLAPMQIGTGLQNKLLEAMSMRIPCVTSSLANRSLKAQNGKNIYVGDSLADYVEIITSLLDDESMRQTMGNEGRKFVEKNYNWNVFNDQLVELFKNKQGDIE